MSKRKKRIGLVVLVLVAAMLVYMYAPMGPVAIEVSPETTVIAGPLNPDGTVNYVAAMDADYAADVTAENNAAPDLLQAMGPDTLPPKVRDAVLAGLGLSAEEVGEGLYQPWEPAQPAEVEWTGPGPKPPFPIYSGNPVGDEPTFIDRDGDPRPLRLADLSDLTWMLRQGQVHPDLEAWLEANEAALDRVSQTVAHKPRLYLPLVSPSIPPMLLEVDLSQLAPFREIGRALLVRAHWRARQGNWGAAWADVLAVHRLSRLIGQGPTLMHQLVAFATEAMAADAGVYLATHGPFDVQAARRHLAQLQALPSLGRLAYAIDRGERFGALDSIAWLSRGHSLGTTGTAPVNAGYAYDWNVVLRRTNEWYDLLAKPFTAPNRKSRDVAMAEVDARLDAFSKRMASTGYRVRFTALGLSGRLGRESLSRWMGDFLMAILMPSTTQSLKQRDRAEAARSVEMAALALAAYRAEAGQWPASLAELSPDLLPTVPVDAFTGKPLIYHRHDEGYLVYSVGINGTDDGGVEDSDAGQDDIAARVPPAPPRLATEEGS